MEPVIRSVAALHCVLTGEVVFIIIIISYGGLLNVYRRCFDQDLPSAYSIAVGLFTFNDRRWSIWHRCITLVRTYIVVLLCGHFLVIVFLQTL